MKLLKQNTYLWPLSQEEKQGKGLGLFGLGSSPTREQRGVLGETSQACSGRMAANLSNLINTHGLFSGEDLAGFGQVESFF